MPWNKCCKRGCNSNSLSTTTTTTTTTTRLVLQAPPDPPLLVSRHKTWIKSWPILKPVTEPWPFWPILPGVNATATRFVMYAIHPLTKCRRPFHLFHQRIRVNNNKCRNNALSTTRKTPNVAWWACGTRPNEHRRIPIGDTPRTGRATKLFNCSRTTTTTTLRTRTGSSIWTRTPLSPTTNSRTDKCFVWTTTRGIPHPINSTLTKSGGRKSPTLHGGPAKNPTWSLAKTWKVGRAFARESLPCAIRPRFVKKCANGGGCHPRARRTTNRNSIPCC
mmetsp:Transcript_28986/g.67803  ORF Transcript_28986/g.67803 Transcript_28986/m.67803 type:complete len:276 (+) Transcript_28986:404-1231(+)